MKKSSANILRALIVFVGIGALAFLLWEPHIEGVNANKTFFEVYFNDPFLAYAYIASIPFFVVLAQTFKVLKYIEKNNDYLPTTIKALQTIEYSVIAMIGFVIGGEIILLSSNNDDHPPVIMMGLFITLVALAITTTAAKYKKMFAKRT